MHRKNCKNDIVRKKIENMRNAEQASVSAWQYLCFDNVLIT